MQCAPKIRERRAFCASVLAIKHLKMQHLARDPRHPASSESSALRSEEEVGISTVSDKLYEHVTQYHAQIGDNVPRDTLQQLEWNLLAEAKTLFHQQKFEEALNTFTHCLAVTEKTRSAKDHAVRGAVIHNIASCLHNLGEMEAAQVGMAHWLAW